MRDGSHINYREYPILYVDDEEENLRIFEITFRREFEILTATSGEQGLEVLAEQPAALILSDHRMPGMSGVEFLARARDLAPETVRMLVTAYGDADTLGRAINDGSIYRYLPKPWDPEDMRLAVRRGLELYQIDRERDVLVRELRALNDLSARLGQELDSRQVTRQLLDAITRDFAFDGASLLIFDAQRRSLRMTASAPEDSSLEPALAELRIRGENAATLVGDLERGKTQLFGLEDAAELGGALGAWLTEVAAEQQLIIPLIGKLGLLGALAVDNRRGGRKFGAAERHLLEGVASQAATTLHNARLMEDLKSTREHVQRADRLGTLGTLAAGLAHEINNPLVSIHTFLSLAADKRQEDDAEFWGDYHRLACAELDRIRGLVNTMSRLGRGESDGAARTPCDIVALAGEVATLLRREADRAGVTLEVEAAPDTPKVVATRDALHQLVLNLTLNGMHACSAGGRVLISVEPTERGVALEIADSGHGIGEEDLERIFDPFFTTKDPDKGTGLGLMICHRIVMDHGGSIAVDSQPGEGARFCVTLPLDGRGDPDGSL